MAFNLDYYLLLTFAGHTISPRTQEVLNSTDPAICVAARFICQVLLKYKTNCLYYMGRETEWAPVAKDKLNRTFKRE